MRILIVDDFPPKLDLLTHLIRQLRPAADVVVAESFQQGRGLLVEGEWAVAFFDNRLHDGSGMALLRIARERGIPALVVSAHDPATVEERREVVPVESVDRLRRRITGAIESAEVVDDG